MADELGASRVIYTSAKTGYGINDGNGDSMNSDTEEGALLKRYILELCYFAKQQDKQEEMMDEQEDTSIMV